MSRALLAFSLLSTTGSLAAPGPKVVYGPDNRIEASEASQVLQQVATSTAAMVPASLLTRSENSSWRVRAPKLGRREQLCPGERFADQITAAACTGFLVGPDLLVTAGHCIKNQRDCASYRWIFDLRQELMGPGVGISDTQIYSCKEIIAQKLERFSKDDFALVRLDRTVVDRTPLEVRMKGKVSKIQDLAVVGHPSGIPLKVATGGAVRQNLHAAFFSASMDSFAGNSGSPVVDAQSGRVEGILVRGEPDYILDRSGNCYRVHTCSQTKQQSKAQGERYCGGEDVTRIRRVPIPH